MPLFMLDTNVCIDFARGRSVRLLEQLEAQPPEALQMSAVTYAELMAGARLAEEDDREKLRALSRIVRVVPFDAIAAESYGRLARGAGLRRKSFDRMIAAHALALGLTLVTSNEGDFADIPDLKVENWTV